VFEPPFDRPDRPQHACFAPGRAACFGWPPPSTAACPLPHNSSEFQELLIEEDLAALTNFFVTSAPDLLRAGRVPLRSFWLFVMGCTVFSPSIVVTGLWQAQLAQKNDLAQMLTLFSVFCGVCAILVALIPMINRVGIILHVVTATLFMISGSICTVR
jgi:hypothetical protein